MNNLDQMIERAPQQLRVMLDEARDEIAEAMQQALAESQESDKAAVVNVPFSIKINLGENGVTYSLTVTRKSKWEVAQPFEDEKQQSIPLTDRDGDPVSPQLAKAVRGFKRKFGNVTVSVPEQDGGGQ